MSDSQADTSAELKQQLAAIEHQRWADWQRWCHEVLRQHVPTSDELENVLRRWDRQIETPYFFLTDKEKASDMEQVDRYWPLIQCHIDAAVRAGINEFCYDLQRKVKLEFEAGGRYPGHLIDPWRDVVRPVVYRRANELKDQLKGGKDG